jgi:lysozyme family protein
MSAQTSGVLGRFPACLAFTLAREGLWSNDARDTGGMTMRGVTLASYREWLGDATVTGAQLRDITTVEVEAFYRVRYWLPIHGDQLPPGVDLMVFDFGVNAGIGRSAKLLQSALNVAADGWIGSATLAAAARRGPVELVVDLATRQEHFYRLCAAFPAFGRGWLSRVAQRKATALSFASPKPGTVETRDA